MNNTVQDLRGRPRKELRFPRGKFTVNTLIERNPDIKCRLTLYNRCQELVQNKVLRLTGNTIAGKVGKPLNEYQTVASYRAGKALKATVKARNKAKIGHATAPVKTRKPYKARKLKDVVVNLTPAVAPVAPVAAVAAVAAVPVAVESVSQPVTMPSETVIVKTTTTLEPATVAVAPEPTTELTSEPVLEAIAA